MTIMTTAKPLLNPRELELQFRECLRNSREVFIASAWARPCEAIEWLRKSKRLIHSIIGTRAGITHPSALEALHLLGPTHIDTREDRLFHPKFFLFIQDESTAEVILGSANLTRGGFESNVEACVCFRVAGASIRPWVDAWNWWRENSTPVTPECLKRYRAKWREPNRGPLASLAKAEDGLTIGLRKNSQLLIDADDLFTCNWEQYQTHLNGKFGTQRDVYDAWAGQALSNYLNVCDAIRNILDGPFPRGGSDDFRKLLGTHRNESIDFGWFGGLGGRGSIATTLSTNDSVRAGVESRLRSIMAANNDSDALESAGDFWSFCKNVPDIGVATTTRFLTLAKPERFFAVNSCSRLNLNLLFEPSPDVGKLKGYLSALQRVWSSPWFRSEKPKSHRSKELWSARVALLDLFVYDRSRK